MLKLADGEKCHLFTFIPGTPCRKMNVYSEESYKAILFFYISQMQFNVFVYV